MTRLAPLITQFLREYLPHQRGFSPQSCETYAHGFKLLFLFAERRLGVRPSQLHVEQLYASLSWTFSTTSRKIEATARPRVTRAWLASNRSCVLSNTSIPRCLSKSRKSAQFRRSVTNRGLSSI